MIDIKVVVVPGAVKEVVLEDGATVADALTAAGYSADGYTINLDGHSDASLDTVLSDGQRIAISKNAKGNS